MIHRVIYHHVLQHERDKAARVVHILANSFTMKSTKRTTIVFVDADESDDSLALILAVSSKNTINLCIAL